MLCRTYSVCYFPHSACPEVVILYFLCAGVNLDGSVSIAQKTTSSTDRQTTVDPASVAR